MTRLVVITGPMFSGKTSNLLIQLSRASAIYEGKTVYITHSCDVREELTSCENPEKSAVGSHSLLARNGFAAADIHMKVNLLSETEGDICRIGKIAAIGIDEAQFFDGNDLFTTVNKWCKIGNPLFIIVAGLDGDANQQPFENSAITRLLPISDEFSKLETAKCIKCIQGGKGLRPAPFTIRNKKSGSSNILDIGGEDKYSAVCREHLG